MAEDKDISGKGPPDAEDRVATRRTLWQRARIRTLKTVALVLLGVVGLALAVIIGIDTGPGHRFVADRIAALRFENGMRIVVGRIEGSLYGKMTLHDLSVRDPAGEFLFSPEIDVDWSPFDYFRDYVNVRSAVAQRMILRRVPKFRATAPSDEPLLPDPGAEPDAPGPAQNPFE